jgi:hypothetical protein
MQSELAHPLAGDTQPAGDLPSSHEVILHGIEGNEHETGMEDALWDMSAGARLDG